jgi:hypothetical protein
VPIPGWSFESRGPQIWLRSEQYPKAGYIVYSERAPLDMALVRRPSSAPREVIVTDEGEYGIMVEDEGRGAGTPARRIFGCVFVDGYQSETLAVCVDESRYHEFQLAMRRLLISDRHMRSQRPRAFALTAPRNWIMAPHGSMMTRRFCPQDSNDASFLITGPAFPSPISFHLLNGDPVVALRGSEQVSTARGLMGRRWRSLNPDGLRTNVMLADGTYFYCLQLYTPSSQCRVERIDLVAVLDSIVPLAKPMVRSNQFPIWARIPERESLHYWTS